MNSEYIEADGAPFFDLIKTYLDPEDRARVRQAFELARQEHGEERRKSGELFFTHPLTVAYYLAQYQLDAPALMAALLHDVVEDTRISVSEIESTFGSEVGRLVHGLTKFQAVAADVETGSLSKEAERDATLHRLFAVMTDDVRVGIIKLFDRLHNMRTIGATSPSSQRRKAEETLAVYAPLANRLGMWKLKNELEGRSFAILKPDLYETISRRLDQIYHQQQPFFATTSHEIAAHLTQADIFINELFLAPENPYTVYQDSLKSANSSARFQVDETPRIVVVLSDIPSCYQALGHLHQLWRPVPNSFDDYIASPRDNLYRSLHTTLTHSSGRRVKVRLRTRAMSILSEIGVLARWVHVGMPLWSEELGRRVDALIANISDNINVEPNDFTVGVQGVVEEVLRRNQIVVYTPKGDAKELPQGATPLDFAYTIHSEVGDQCRAALVNDRPVPLNTTLKDGDRVQIVKRGHAPQRVWLDEDLGFITTHRARAQVRRWFRRLSSEVAVHEGQRLVEDELAMLGLSDYSHEVIASWLGYEWVQEFYHAVGRAELLPTAVATEILERTWHEGPTRQIGSPITTDNGVQLTIAHANGRQLHLCRTCNPGPDDEIVGHVLGNGKVTVHKEGCRMVPIDPFSARTLKLKWVDEELATVRLFTLRIDVYDRSGLLKDIAELIHNEDINIPAVHAESEDGQAEVLLDLEVVSPRQFVRLLHRTLALVNVFSVTCLSRNGDGPAQL
ncbi:MAG: HD domain-containing protein [Candidatus Promineifilaceae bacterium]|nr:HD domain-containing protein [Candidatus Promineifilaceae bacterium]